MRAGRRRARRRRRPRTCSGRRRRRRRRAAPGRATRARAPAPRARRRPAGRSSAASTKPAASSSARQAGEGRRCRRAPRPAGGRRRRSSCPRAGRRRSCRRRRSRPGRPAWSAPGRPGRRAGRCGRRSPARSPTTPPPRATTWSSRVIPARASSRSTRSASAIVFAALARLDLDPRRERLEPLGVERADGGVGDAEAPPSAAATSPRRAGRGRRRPGTRRRRSPPRASSSPAAARRAPSSEGSAGATRPRSPGGRIASASCLVERQAHLEQLARRPRRCCASGRSLRAIRRQASAASTCSQTTTWRPSASRTRSERTLPPPSAIAPPSASLQQRADDLRLAGAEGLLAVAPRRPRRSACRRPLPSARRSRSSPGPPRARRRAPSTCRRP